MIMGVAPSRYIDTVVREVPLPVDALMGQGFPLPCYRNHFCRDLGRYNYMCGPVFTSWSNNV